MTHTLRRWTQNPPRRSLSSCLGKLYRQWLPMMWCTLLSRPANSSSTLVMAATECVLAFLHFSTALGHDKVGN